MTYQPLIYRIKRAQAIDLGEPYDIHPKDKMSIAKRCVNSFLKKSDSESFYDGPYLDVNKYILQKNNIKIFFHNLSVLKVKGDIKNVLELYAEDLSVICIKNIVVHSTYIEVEWDEGAKPSCLRYSYNANPTAWIYNHDELPVLPFEINFN